MKSDMKKKYTNYFKYIKFIYIDNVMLLFLFLLFVVICSDVILVTIPILQQKSIDKLIYTERKDYFMTMLFIMSIFYLLDILFNILKDYYGVKLVEKINFILREKLNMSISRMHYKYFNENDIEKASHRYTNDINVLSNHFGNIIIDSIKYFGMFILIIFSIKTIDSSLLIFTLVTLFIYLIFNKYVGIALNRAINEYFKKNEESLGIFLENRKNVFLVKMFNLYEVIQHRFQESYITTFKSKMRTEKVYCLNINSTKFILHFLNIIVFFIIGGRVLEGKSTVGNLVAMIQYQNMIISPFYFLAVFNNSFQSVLNSIERIDEFYNADFEILDQGESIDNINSIECKNLYFSYKPDSFVLKNINLKANKGEIIGILGSSGSGKSTLINLLLGIYEPTNGSILINNRDISEIKLESIRASIGCVVQESLFFTESILYNLFVSENELSDVINLAKEIDINDEISKLPNLYQTVLLSNANNLSVGQKKRLDILRVLLSKKEVLIFDESTAMIDKKRRELFFDTIKEIKKEKIIFLISHNTEEFSICDRVYKI